MRGKAEVYIEASPEKVFQLISDVTRIGEWSPECRRCEWVGEPAGPAVGARFRGHNRRGWVRWKMPCRVTAAEPGRAFAIETLPPFPFGKGVQSRWSYELVPSEGGTLLTESFEVLWYIRWIVRLLYGGAASRLAQLEESVNETLARIKAAAEAAALEPQ